MSSPLAMLSALGLFFLICRGKLASEAMPSFSLDGKSEEFCNLGSSELGVTETPLSFFRDFFVGSKIF